MSTTFSGIETLISSLRAQAMAQRVVGHNIANATTRGYSRQSSVLTSIAPVNYAGFNTIYGVQQVGAGVTLSSVSRVRNEFLDLQMRFELSSRGQEQVIYDATQVMRIIFPELNAVPGSGLMTAVDTFFADWTTLAGLDSPANRQTLVDNAKNMTTLFHEASDTLLQVQRTADGGVKESMARISDLLAQIAGANKGIMAAESVGGVANDLMDKRDLALADLSELMKVDVVKLADGSVLVMTGNARTLVRGALANELVATVNPHDSQFVNVGLRDSATLSVIDITDEISGGKIKGQLVVRDELAADRLLAIDSLAYSMIEQVNLIHRAGYALDNSTNRDFFAGSEARDIIVNPVISATPALVAATRVYLSGDTEQAETIGLLEQMVMNMSVGSSAQINVGPGALIDPTALLSDAVGTARNVGGSNSVNFATALAAAGTIVINGVAMAWDATVDSIDDVVDRINNLGVGARASFDYTSQELSIVSERPLTIYDAAGNLTESLNLQTRVTSLSPINNGIGPMDRPIDPAISLSASLLQYRTLVDANSVITVSWDAPAGTQNSITYRMPTNILQSGGAISNMVDMIDPTVSMLSAVPTALNVTANPNSLNWVTALATPSGTLTINGVAIAWDTGVAAIDSIDDLITSIENSALAGSVTASFDYATQTFALVSDRPISVTEGVGENLKLAMNLNVQTFSTPSLDTILNDPLVGINARLTLASAPFTLTFDPATQTIRVDGSSTLPSSVANPISSISVTNTFGNLGDVMQLSEQPIFSAFKDEIMANMQSEMINSQSMKDQADAAVAQIELQWDAISKVNVDEEKARLFEYLRAYEAAVKAMSVLDEALNVLINKMAVTSGGSGSGSVISS